MISKTTSSILKIFIAFIVNIIVVVILFLIFEGYSSFIVIYNKIKSPTVVSERHHTQYDEEIGWINLPNIHIENLYGPGRYLTTNSQMFRSDKDYSASIPRNKVRMICSGDSHTLGFGVSNDNTWCKLLESFNNRIETVNLGQGGYGVDQAYLWYKRNMTKLDHDIHIFAFISADFKRMQKNSFLGYGKPYLELHNGVIVNKNRPVPEHSYLTPKLAVIQRDLSQLNILRFLRQKFFPDKPTLNIDNQYSEVQKVALKIFENLHKVSQLEDRILVIVYLPQKIDHNTTYSDLWRKQLKEEAARNGWLFIDLIKEFRKYPENKLCTLYRGHYNELGYAYIADILYKELIAIPEISDKLAKK